MIKACGISKVYRVQGLKKTVFENLNLTLTKGERLALIGPNGTGKSTLLRVLSGIEKPNKGKIIRTSTISWPVGLNAGFIPTFSGRENVLFVSKLMGDKASERQSRVHFIKQFADIGDYFDMPVQIYSSGMKSRLAFGLSLAFDFDYYVIDEAMSTGDINFRKKFEKIFSEKIKGKGLLLVSHNMNTIKQYCTKGIFLNNGKVYYDANLDNVISMYQGLANKKKELKA